MKATTYLQAAERRTADAVGHSRVLERIAKGDLGAGAYAPSQYLAWTLDNALVAHRLTSMALEKTDDVYLRNRAMILDELANNAARSASFDIDAAEHVRENAKTCEGCGYPLDAQGMCTAPLSAAD